MRAGSGGVEPGPLPVPAYVRGGCVTSQSRRDVSAGGHHNICCLNVEGSVEPTAPPIAAFFDLDKTVIAKSSTLAFGRPFYQHGLISRSDALRSVAGHLVFRIAGANHNQMERIREWVSGLCRGWPVDRVSEIVARYLDELILPYIYAEARALIATHRDAGQDVIIVSTSGHEVVDPIAKLLGVDDVIATRMEVAGGRYTGVIEFYAYGEAKAARVRELAAERGYPLADCYAYSDSATDLPLLETVGHPHAVNPDRALRRIAAQRGWPILDFSRLGAHSEPRESRQRLRITR
jgi:HAD superfamily hydrolase (TIGR01490 family)